MNIPAVSYPLEASSAFLHNRRVEAANTYAQKLHQNKDDETKRVGAKYLIPAAKLITKPIRWFARNLHNIVVYTLLLGTAGIFTPGFWKAVNYGLQTNAIELVPRPSNLRNINETYNEVPYDSFFRNFHGFNEILDTIRKANINPFDLDINKNGYILDSKEEVRELILRFEEAKKTTHEKETIEQYNNAINLLTRFNSLSQLIWGTDGPKADNVSQRNEPTCQGMSFLKGLFLTPENTQYAKGLITVTDYNLGPNPTINTSVRINGKNILVDFSELEIAMSPQGYNPSQSNDGSLFTTILSHAMKKSSPDKIPNIWPSSSPILLTDRNHSTIAIISLTNEELREYLSKAPDTVITVASTFDINDIKNGINYRSNNWVSPQYSPEKINEFRNAMSDRALLLSSTPKGTSTTGQPALVPVSMPAPSSTNTSKGAPPPVQIASSFPPSSAVSGNNQNIGGAKDISQGHIYVIEKYNSENDTLTLVDSHGVRINLTGDEIRDRLIAIVLPNEDVNSFGLKGLPIYGLVIGLGALYRFGGKKIKLILSPEPTYGQRLGKKISEYLNTAKGRRFIDDQLPANGAEEFIAREDLFAFAAIALLKTALQLSGIGEEEILGTFPDRDKFLDLSSYLGIGEDELTDLINMAKNNPTLTKTIKALTLDEINTKDGLSLPKIGYLAA